MKENAETSRLVFTKARKPFVVPIKHKVFNKKKKTNPPPPPKKKNKQTNKQKAKDDEKTNHKTAT